MSDEEMTEAEDHLLSVLWQACGDPDTGEIDNKCLHAYERACGYLEKKGYIEKINSRIFMKKEFKESGCDG